MTVIGKVACIGAGLIGAGWVARLVHNGIDVVVHDPAEGREQRVARAIKAGGRAMAGLTPRAGAAGGTVSFASTIADAVRDADLIQESIPEREDLKRRILAEACEHARPEALICSSTSGLLPSRLQADMRRPERFLVGHPFNPVYLLPLVETCGGERTAAASLDRADGFYRSIGMKPLRLRKEIDGFISDRLQEAVWREALWLVRDGVATVEEIDDAIRFGPGLRWAIMGSFLCYRLAGGDQGMPHFLAQFGPTMKLPLTKLVAPELTDHLIETIADQSDEQAAGVPIAHLERLRDDCLIKIIRALATENFGAGAVLAAHNNERWGC